MKKCNNSNLSVSKSYHIAITYKRRLIKHLYDSTHSVLQNYQVTKNKMVKLFVTFDNEVIQKFRQYFILSIEDIVKSILYRDTNVH